jgi:hypothetical protein
MIYFVKHDCNLFLGHKVPMMHYQKGQKDDGFDFEPINVYNITNFLNHNLTIVIV